MLAIFWLSSVSICCFLYSFLCIFQYLCVGWINSSALLSREFVLMSALKQSQKYRYFLFVFSVCRPKSYHIHSESRLNVATESSLTVLL